MIEADYKTFSFSVSEANFEIFSKSFNEIKNLIGEKRDIPYTLVDVVINLALPSSYVINDQISKKEGAFINKAVKYFSEIPNDEYVFTGIITFQSDDGTEQHQVYSLHNLFHSCIFNYNKNQLAKKREIEKDEAIRFFYTEIEKYRNSSFNDYDTKKLTHYKIAVMAAYLTMLTERKIVSKKNPTRKDLFQASKNALKGIAK